MNKYIITTFCFMSIIVTNIHAHNPFDNKNNSQTSPTQSPHIKNPYNNPFNGKNPYTDNDNLLNDYNPFKDPNPKNSSEFQNINPFVYCAAKSINK